VEPIYVEPPQGGVRFDADPEPVGSATELAALTAGGGDGDSCGLAAGLQSALQGDNAVRAAVARIPREAKSVAGAIQLWDGRWVELSRGDTAPIRAAIDRHVRAGPRKLPRGVGKRPPVPCRRRGRGYDDVGRGLGLVALGRTPDRWSAGNFKAALRHDCDGLR
jgi:hypothetical protein